MTDNSYSKETTRKIMDEEEHVRPRLEIELLDWLGFGKDWNETSNPKAEEDKNRKIVDGILLSRSSNPAEQRSTGPVRKAPKIGLNYPAETELALDFNMLPLIRRVKLSSASNKESEERTHVRPFDPSQISRYNQQETPPSFATDRALALSLASRSELCNVVKMVLGGGGAEHHVRAFDPDIYNYFRTLCSLGFSWEDRLKRPSATDRSLPLSLASSYKGMRLGTLQSKEQAARLKAIRAMNRTVESMRTKIGIKNNVIRKLPKNCPY